MTCRQNAHLNTQIFLFFCAMSRNVFIGTENVQPSFDAISTFKPKPTFDEHVDNSSRVTRQLLEHDKVIRYLVEHMVAPEKAKSQKVRLELHPILFGLMIMVLTMILGFSIKALSTSMSNDSKLSKMIDMLVIKYPDMRFEVDTMRMHQDIASAPVLFIARVLTFLFGRVSTSLIMVIDKVLKLVLSALLVSAIAYLFLKQSEQTQAEEPSCADPVEDLLHFIDKIGSKT